MDAWPLWNYNEGQKVKVVCYTNAAKARLELDGKVVGEVKDYDQETGIISWDVPFQSGKLEAVGLDKNNKVISRYVISSSKQPQAIVVKSADAVINKDKGVAEIRLQIVDENGVPVMVSDNEITCEIISGSASLLGLEAGNNSDMTDYTDNVQRVFHGHILAYIQSNRGNTPINVKFSSPWLKSVEVTVNVK